LNRYQLLSALDRYMTPFPGESIFIDLLKDLLQHPNAYERDHLPGHMTGSAFIADESGKYFLLTHHAKLDRWLQPGGHADGDEDIHRVAIREAQEETGLKDFNMLNTGLFDIDIHLIPARADFPAHYHYDVRVLLSASRNSPLILTNESHALEWIPVDLLDGKTRQNGSIRRMAEKAARLFAA
jgi:8-oxo-dGTP pyrophosphatase MutT (NUDIX family)